VNDREMALIEERLERGKRRVQAEESIEIENLILGDGDAGAHRVIVLLAIGDDNIEAVGGAALEDYDEAAIWCGQSLRHHGANQKAGNRGCACDRESAVTKKESPIHLLHKIS
jgi:hypothetical protein